MSSLVLCFMRVVENDMSFSYLIYFTAISMVSFRAFMCICGVVLIINTFALTYAHSIAPADKDKQAEEPRANWTPQMRKHKNLLLACKFTNVALTIIAFLSIFVSKLSFDIGEDILKFEERNGDILV